MIDIWLTERHTFFQSVGGTLYKGDIHHREWPLQRIMMYSGQITGFDGERNTVLLNGIPTLQLSIRT